MTQSSKMRCSIILLLLLSPHYTRSIDTHARAGDKGKGRGQGKGKGKGKGQTTIDQTASEISRSRVLAQQQLHARLSMETQAQAWAKAQAESMAHAQASMAAQEQAALNLDAQAHARSEAAVYAEMDAELRIAQTAASANTPSLVRNPRLANKHRKATLDKKTSKQAALLEEMLTPKQVQQRQFEEDRKRKARRLAKLPKIEDADEDWQKHGAPPAPPAVVSFLQVHAAPAWWPSASVSASPQKSSLAPPMEKQSLSNIVSSLFDAPAFRESMHRAPSSFFSSSPTSHLPQAPRLFHHQHPMNLLAVQDSTQGAMPPREKSSSFDQQLRSDATQQFQQMVKTDQTRTAATEQRNNELANPNSGSNSGSNTNTPPPQLFGDGVSPGEQLSSGGNPFAGSMPPPGGVKYTYSQIDASNSNGNGNSNGRPPPPPPPAAAAPPSSPGAATPMTTSGGAIRENQIHMAAPQPVNPDSLVDKQFLPSSTTSMSTTDEPLGGIAAYETEPFRR